MTLGCCHFTAAGVVSTLGAAAAAYGVKLWILYSESDPPPTSIAAVLARGDFWLPTSLAFVMIFISVFLVLFFMSMLTCCCYNCCCAAADDDDDALTKKKKKKKNMYVQLETIERGEAVPSPSRFKDAPKSKSSAALKKKMLKRQRDEKKAAKKALIAAPARSVLAYTIK